MQCKYADKCGGCLYRHLKDEDYQALKQEKLEAILKRLQKPASDIDKAIFITDGCRRRVTMTFAYTKGRLDLGFNEKSSHRIVDIEKCCLVTEQINQALPQLRDLLIELCSHPYQIKQGKKIISKMLQQGDVAICAADNGIDVVLEYDAPIDLNARMAVAEFGQDTAEVIRISHRKRMGESAEILWQQAAPCVKMGKYIVQIPGGTFLQASKNSEQALAEKVLEYLGNTKGKIADLFCGVGTFSYYIASNLEGVKLTAVDSGEELLQGFRASINANQINNVEIKKQNLFKYPLSSGEVSEFAAIVFDPPRAGAKEQCLQIAKAEKKPAVLVAVSCNPETFVNDANILIEAGYNLEKITLVDQFVYSNHSELVAKFVI